MRMRARLVALGLAGLLLTSCGADEGPSGTEPASESAAPDGGDPAASDPDELDSDSAGDLASMAEGLAGKRSDSSVAPRKGPVLGSDISWPQCPEGMGIPERPTLGMPMPVDEAEYVIIGLTNGPAFTPNPCLADQVDWSKERELMVAAYAVTSYPTRQQLRQHGGDGPHDGDTRLGALRNVGYQQASYNLGVMRDAGLETPVVWIDVEPVPAPYGWSSDPKANAAVVEGVARGYRDAGYRIGFYSNVGLWQEVVGDLSLGLPEWRATGDEGRAGALAGCLPGKAFQDGRPVMGQWLEARRDHNVTCPGVSADLGRWFHQY